MIKSVNTSPVLSESMDSLHRSPLPGSTLDDRWRSELTIAILANFTNLSPIPIISRACGTDMSFTTDRLCPLLEQCTYSLILAVVPL